MPKSYIDKILKARVYEVAQQTPLQEAKQLSKRLSHKVWIKREDMQPVFSFKLRGAYNKLVHLSKEQQEKGVIAASAGNHAQGLALSAKKYGVKATIVMPKTTPPIKVKAVQGFGGHAVLFGDTYDEAYAHALELAKAHGYTFIHPYDDPEVIAGQGTVAMEILHQHSGPIDAIFIPVGGGGLIAGMAAYIKHVRPEIKVIGVEPEEAACLYEALKAKTRVVLDKVGIFADGVAVRQVGAEPYRIAKTCVDEVILVSTDEICAAIKDIFEETRSIAEPAGALGIAGLKKYVARREAVKGQTLIAIDSGANVNFDRLRHIAERADVGEFKEALLAVTIPEIPGSFKTFCKILGKRSVTEFNYRYAETSQAHIFVGIELHKPEEKEALIDSLKAHGYAVVDLTHNEVAKLHIRHMVGGRGPNLSDEKLFRFEFPERPGALLHFLNGMEEKWNISLFHYRNHGAAYGRVLAGIQVPQSEVTLFEAFLRNLGYVYTDETQNPAFKLFL